VKRQGLITIFTKLISNQQIVATIRSQHPGAAGPAAWISASFPLIMAYYQNFLTFGNRSGRTIALFPDARPRNPCHDPRFHPNLA
jgi:hypothetical protein